MWQQFSPVRLWKCILNVISGRGRNLRQTWTQRPGDKSWLSQWDMCQAFLRRYFWPAGQWGTDIGVISLRRITCFLAFWGKKQAFVWLYWILAPVQPVWSPQQRPVGTSCTYLSTIHTTILLRVHFPKPTFYFLLGMFIYLFMYIYSSV